MRHISQNLQLWLWLWRTFQYSTQLKVAKTRRLGCVRRPLPGLRINMINSTHFFRLKLLSMLQVQYDYMNGISNTLIAQLINTKKMRSRYFSSFITLLHLLSFNCLSGFSFVSRRPKEGFSWEHKYLEVLEANTSAATKKERKRVTLPLFALELCHLSGRLLIHQQPLINRVMKAFISYQWYNFYRIL